MLIPELSDWFEEYAERNTTGPVTPAAHIGAIDGGWPFKPDFSPSACNLYLDLRVSPRSSPEDVIRQFQEFVEQAGARHPELHLSWEPYVTVPGSHTPPENWVVQSCIRAWERVEDQPHVAGSMGGMTDAEVLRTWGIPTARLGGASSRPADPSLGFFGRQGADLGYLMRLARCYIYTIIDTCTRPRAEVLGV